jgi:hypothetical protein
LASRAVQLLPTGQIREFPTDKDTTIGAIKAELSNREGVPVQRIRLSFGSHDPIGLASHAHLDMQAP